MLIVPIETKPNWNRPPIVTIAIVLINLLVFVFYQSGDEQVAKDAVKYYLQNKLLEKEQQLIEAHLHKQTQERARIILQQKSFPHYQEMLAYYVFYEPSFDNTVAREWSKEIHPDDEWINKRKAFEEYREHYSSFAYGLVPAESGPLNYLTCTFLHGSWGHIVGNMVFLFLFGFLLELVLGPFIYLGIYLLTGVLASYFFVMFNQESYVPLVGASGAVSGLMGAYIVMYGVRKIRFFYTVGFYFGEFKAPALAILPLWIAKEVYGHFQLANQVAYLAHLGGMISGALAMAAYNKIQPQQAEQKIEELAPEEEQEKKQANYRVLQDVSKLCEKLDFDAARQRCKSFLAQNPSDMAVWRALFDLEKVNANQKSFHQMSFDFVKQVITQPKAFKQHSKDIRLLVNEYCEITKNPVIFKNDTLTTRLICFFFESHEEHFAIKLLELHLDKVKQNKSANKAFQHAENFFKNSQSPKKARVYTKLMQEGS